MRIVLACLLLSACSQVSRADPEDIGDVDGQTLLAFNGTTLFGATGGAVWRIQNGSPSRDTLFTGAGAISDFLADSAGLYFTQAPLTDEHTRLRRVALDGAGAADVGINVQRASVRQDSEYLYWFDKSGAVPAIMRAKKSGGTAAKIADAGLTTTPEMAVDDTHVYWVDFTAPVTIKRVEKAGGTPANVKVNTVATALNVDAASLHYVSKATAPARLLSLGKDGGEPTEIAPDVDRFHADASYLYFTTLTTAMPQRQSLSRATPSGKLVEILVRDMKTTTPVQLASGGGFVFWSDGKNVVKLPSQ
ncbi:MAG: DUF5050 domain-containing protein [Deltaproteobacteria bacterium]|nr:DUF5050 domain-containing protein [Deltaproteobacteria bacterium]